MTFFPKGHEFPCILVGSDSYLLVPIHNWKSDRTLLSVMFLVRVYLACGALCTHDMACFLFLEARRSCFTAKLFL